MAVDSDHVWHSRSQAGPTVGDDDPTVDILPDPCACDEVDGHSGARPGADPFEPGRVLGGRYELERVAGRGGFCVVLAARDRRRQAAGDDDARVAIKALRPELRGDDEARGRLTGEFRQLQQLSHPNIVRVFDLDRHGDDWFVVMELLEGVSLAGLIQHCQGDGVPARKAFGIVKSCAEALGWAHGRGVVHGDVKPGNVFVMRDDGVRLLDFGLPSPRLSAGGHVSAFATPAYASPQVLEGAVPTVADDVYSLGCVAFELLTGLHPFGRVDAREARVRGLHPDEASSLPGPARAALEAALSFDPERRPPDMEAFLALLEPGETASVPVAARAARWRARGSRGRWIASLVMLAGVVAATLLLGADPPAAPTSTSLPAVPATGPSSPDARASEEDQVPAGAATGVEAAREEAAAASGAAATPPGPAPAARRVLQGVGFEQGALLVSRSAPAAAVPLRRIDGNEGRVVLAWRVEEGSARSGRDFAGPLSGTIVLADGQERATLFIPLLDAGDTTDDRRFSVLVDEVSGAAGRGDLARVDVTLRSFVPAGSGHGVPGD